MSNKNHDPATSTRIKVGSPRVSKKRKGNAPSKTSRRGNGKKLR